MKVCTRDRLQWSNPIGGGVSTFADDSMSITVLSWKELTYVIVLVGFLPQCMPPLVAIKQINSRSCLLAYIPDPFVRWKLQTHATSSTFLHISVEGAQPDRSFHQCPNWSLFLLLFCFFCALQTQKRTTGSQETESPSGDWMSSSSRAPSVARCSADSRLSPDTCPCTQVSAHVGTRIGLGLLQHVDVGCCDAAAQVSK